MVLSKTRTIPTGSKAASVPHWMGQAKNPSQPAFSRYTNKFKNKLVIILNRTGWPPKETSTFCTSYLATYVRFMCNKYILLSFHNYCPQTKTHNLINIIVTILVSKWQLYSYELMIAIEYKLLKGGIWKFNQLCQSFIEVNNIFGTTQNNNVNYNFGREYNIMTNMGISQSAQLFGRTVGQIGLITTLPLKSLYVLLWRL